MATAVEASLSSFEGGRGQAGGKTVAEIFLSARQISHLGEGGV